MRNPSSIFSFSTLTSPPSLPRSSWLSLVVVLAFAAALHPLGSAIAVRDPTSRIANSIRYLRSREPMRPRVLFLGSSRTMSCIDVETFAQGNELPPDTVLNVARPDMGPWEALVILRNAPTVLASVDTVFVEISPLQFNDHRIHPITHKKTEGPAEFAIWATWRERARTEGLVARCRLLAEYVFPLAHRRNLATWLRIAKAVLTDKPWAGDMSPPSFHTNPSVAAILAQDANFQAATIARCHLQDYHFCNQSAMIVRDLLAMLRRYRVEVVILHPPVQKEYYDYVASHAELLPQFEKYRAFMRDLAEEHQVIGWETVEDSGLDDSVLVDYGHFTHEGAMLFTRRLCDEIRACAALRRQ